MVHGVTFNEQLVTSANMAHAHHIFAGKKSGITKGCAVTYSGRNLYVSAGYMITCGRISEITSQETIEAPEVSSGTCYCRLVYEVDLSKTNTEEAFTQGYFRILQSYSAYPALTQEDLDNGGSVYQLPFAKFTVTSSGIGNFTNESVTFDTVTQVTLTVAGWSNAAPFTQTVQVPFVTANDKPPQGIIYPNGCTDNQRKEIQRAASMIIEFTTADGSVTFKATAKPSVDITLGLHV